MVTRPPCDQTVGDGLSRAAGTEDQDLLSRNRTCPVFDLSIAVSMRSRDKIVGVISENSVISKYNSVAGVNLFDSRIETRQLGITADLWEWALSPRTSIPGLFQ